jgi:lactate dehydrogenase-like 2-hydroxyacid dehydrogenase
MQAVFLDKGTFSDNIDLPAPAGVTDYITYDDTPQELIIERCQNADIIFTNKVQISADVIANLPKLKLIQLTATGMNNVDQDACAKHNVALYNVAGYAVKSVPEHTFMLMLTAMRAGIYYHEKVADGTWQDDGNFCLLDIPLIDLEEKTLGIIGVGTIGKRVTDVNVARGGIVDSQALSDAINNEQIIGYATDVFEQEPIVKDDPLLTLSNHPRVIFSPHNAWGSKSAQETLWQILSKQVSEFIDKH